MSDLPTILEVNPNSVTLEISQGGGFVDTIATVATFSALGSATTAGQLKRTADTGDIYVSDGTAWAIVGGGGGSGDFSGSTSLSATLAPADVLSFAVTVAGAQLGKGCRFPGFSPALPAGMFASASVTATDTVTVSLLNFTGSSQTISSVVSVEVSA